MSIRMIAELQDELDQIRKERDRYKEAIENCIEYANNRESEWGSRAATAFEYLYEALEK